MHDRLAKLRLYCTNAPKGAAPLQLTAFSKPLIETQYYISLEHFRMCARRTLRRRRGGKKKRAFLRRTRCQSPPHSTFIYPPAPTRSIACQLWLQQHWQDLAAPEGFMRLCIPEAMIVWITQTGLEAAVVLLSFMQEKLWTTNHWHLLRQKGKQKAFTPANFTKLGARYLAGALFFY